MSRFSSIKRQRLLPGAAFLLAALFLYRPILKPGVFLFGNDTIYHDYIMLLYGWRLLRGAMLPLWLPYLYSGIPFIGSFAFCPFYPPSWLFFLLPFPLAFNVQYLLHSLLAGVFMYRLLRAFGLKRFPCVLGGLAFQLSGHFATLCYPGHLQKVQSIVWLPLALSFLHRGLYTGRRRHFLLSGFALAMPLLASHPQIYYLSAGVMLLYFLWCIADRRRRPLGVPGSRLAPLFALVIFFSIALSASQLLPGLETSRYSVRAGGMSFQDAVKSSFPPGELPEIFLPRFTGDSIRGGIGEYHGKWGERLVSDYVGMAVFFLALAGGLFSRRVSKFFFNALFLLTVLTASGVYSPVYRLMYHVVPGMNRFRSPATAMFLMSLSIAVLAAFGMEALWNRFRERKDKKRFLLALLLVALVFLILLFFLHGYGNRLFDKWEKFESSGQFETARFYRKLLFLVMSIRRSAFFSLVFFTSLAFLFHTRHLFMSGKIPRIASRLVGAVFLFLLAVDPAMNDRAFIQAESAPPYHRYLFRTWPDPLLKRKQTPVRVHDIGGELANRHMMSGIGVPLGYHPIELRHYIDTWNAAGPGSLKAARLTGCHYIVASRAEKRRDWDLVDRDPKGKQSLYQWRENTPYAFVPGKIESMPAGEKILKTIQARDFNPHELSYILSPESFFKKRSRPEGEYHIRILDYHSNSVRLETDFPENSFLVLADTWMPGWKAKTEAGEALQLYRANGAFRCIEIPRGKKIVTMFYRPDSIIFGICISVIALALWIGLLYYLYQSDREKVS